MEDGVAIAVWAAAAALLVVAEILTLTFVALYFAAGALAASLAAAFGGGTAVQLLVFAIVSVGSLLLTRRPLLQAMQRQPVVPSNAPTVVGKRAVVIKPILEGPGQRGQVRVGTEHWSARAEARRRSRRTSPSRWSPSTASRSSCARCRNRAFLAAY